VLGLAVRSDPAHIGSWEEAPSLSTSPLRRWRRALRAIGLLAILIGGFFDNNF
jgi:hypothetical protein